MVIIILACSNMVEPIIAVIIVGRDIIVDSIKMLIGNKGKAVAAIPIAKYKTATLMIGLTLKLFYDLIKNAPIFYVFSIIATIGIF